MSLDSQSWIARLTPTVVGLAIATFVYVGGLLFSPSAWLPGDPVWAIQPETLQEIVNESLNFFFVLPLVNQVGIHVMEAPVVHPMLQALFNGAEAWIFMFLPLLLQDPRGRRLPTLGVWLLAMFLTNVFLMPYMAVRLLYTPEVRSDGELPVWIRKGFGWMGLIVGTLAVGWAVFALPEFGGIGDRWSYFWQQVAMNRVTLAFCVDGVLFYMFQVWLMGAIIPVQEPVRRSRWVPLWGLAFWLIV